MPCTTMSDAIVGPDIDEVMCRAAALSIMGGVEETGADGCEGTVLARKLEGRRNLRGEQTGNVLLVAAQQMSVGDVQSEKTGVVAVGDCTGSADVLSEKTGVVTVRDCTE